MALLFSAVTVTAGEDEIELLVGGIPREYDDLEGWSEFDDLMCFISEETEVSVRAEAYLYGEGESMRASPEEIDDLMQRMKDDTGFLNRCCALPGFVDSKNEEKTERNAGYLVVSQSGGGMLRQGTREGIRRTPANRGMRAHRIVKGLDISEDVCHGMCP